MPLREIRALPVADVCTKDAAFFMWAVDCMLPEAIDVGAGWGFKFKTVAFTWAKVRQRRPRWQRRHPPVHGGPRPDRGRPAGGDPAPDVPSPGRARQGRDGEPAQADAGIGPARRRHPPRACRRRHGVAEGIETALAAAQLFEQPVWAAISSAMLEKWTPPAGCNEVAVYADNDRKFGGQAAAYALAHRLSRDFDVTVKLTPIVGSDWNDVLRARGNRSTV
jgi:hypothetical protein